LIPYEKGIKQNVGAAVMQLSDSATWRGTEFAKPFQVIRKQLNGKSKRNAPSGNAKNKNFKK